jgi:septal ring factor EnvC (AmiA/AmiB activator)
MNSYTFKKETKSMKHSTKRITKVLAIGFISTIGFIGCSSKPTQDELSQLANVRSEITSLEQRKSSLEQERATLTQSIAAKESQLKTCQNDKAAVKEKLHE